MTTIITYGTFDMLHQGHINILKRAKSYGEKLIVGVTSEKYDIERGKLNVVQSLSERIKAVEALPFVDEVIVEEYKEQKQHDIVSFCVDKFIIGDDWVGKFDYLKEFCEVIYLPRTKGISSTLIRKDMEQVTIGIIGTGRIAKRFISDANKYNDIIVKSVFSRNMQRVTDFVHENEVLYGFDNIDDFLDSGLDAVYIASPHETHFMYSKTCILAKKHVLCEKPATLNQEELKELILLSKKHDVVFLEAVKTAFLPAFSKVLSELESGIVGNILEVRSTFTKLVADKNGREFDKKFGGATNELATYPLLLATKILGKPKNFSFYPILNDDNIDIANRIITTHENGQISISTVGISMKQEGSAIISGTKGYLYIPAPWWLTKTFYVRFEDQHKEIEYNYDYVGDGLSYEISEFTNLIRRKKVESEILTHNDMISLNLIISNFNETTRNLKQ